MLPGGRTIRQDNVRLSAAQVKDQLIPALAEVGDAKEVNKRKYEETRMKETEIATNKKARAQAVGDVTRTMQFFENLSAFGGGSEESQAQFRNLAATGFILSQRVASSGLREMEAQALVASGSEQ